jgi:hypothetical protein
VLRVYNQQSKVLGGGYSGVGKGGPRVVANNLKSLEVSMYIGVGKGELRVVANNLKSPGYESGKEERGEEVKVVVAANILNVL